MVDVRCQAGYRCLIAGPDVPSNRFPTTMPKLRFFQQSTLATDCDQCGARVDVVQGGVCEKCRRILCYRHLYGSWFQRLRTEYGAPVHCVECRAGRTPPARGHPRPARGGDAADR